jgi:hypothetical protein
MTIAMGILAAVGITCLGIIIGWLVRFSVEKFKDVTPKVLTSVVSLILGGVITGFISRTAAESWVLLFYPIGLVIGFATRRYDVLRRRP